MPTVTKMRINKVNVYPNDNKWIVRTEGCERAYRIVESQAEAIQIGRKVAIKRKCELWVYRTDGSVRSKDTFGVDPFPPRK